MHPSRTASAEPSGQRPRGYGSVAHTAPVPPTVTPSLSSEPCPPITLSLDKDTLADSPAIDREVSGNASLPQLTSSSDEPPSTSSPLDRRRPPPLRPHLNTDRPGRAPSPAFTTSPSSRSSSLARVQNWNDDPSPSRGRVCWTSTTQFIRRRLPILAWLFYDPGYNWRSDLSEDLFAGATIAAVIIPQSMAYAMLASLPAVHGLYTSLVPTILYSILGTSRHMSTGTFAITSLLLGQLAHQILADQGYGGSTPDEDYHRRYQPLCLVLTMVVGLIQIVLSMARLGRWTSRHLLPVALVSGFNTASAFHIGTHQLKHLLGMSPARESGAFGMIKTWIWIVQHFGEEVNLPSLFMGLAAMALMYALQRIEHYRRFKADLALGIPSPSPSAISSAPPLTPRQFPALPSPSSSHPSSFGRQPSSSPSPPAPTPAPTPNSLPPSRSKISCGSPRLSASSQLPPLPPPRSSARPLARRNSIVPAAVSDLALLTVQDMVMERGHDCDSGSSNSSTWSPSSSPSQVLPYATHPPNNGSTQKLHQQHSQSSFDWARSGHGHEPGLPLPGAGTGTGSRTGRGHRHLKRTPSGHLSTGLESPGMYGRRASDRPRTSNKHEVASPPKLHRFKHTLWPPGSPPRSPRLPSHGFASHTAEENQPLLTGQAFSHSAPNSRRGSTENSAIGPSGAGGDLDRLSIGRNASTSNLLLPTSSPSRLGSWRQQNEDHAETHGYSSDDGYDDERDCDYNCNQFQGTRSRSSSKPLPELALSEDETKWRLLIPKVHFPIPDIFLCVVLFTAATVYWNLDEEYGIEVIGYIPTGLPSAAWPLAVAQTQTWTWIEWRPLIWPGILLAMVTYVMSLSVAKHFGREYEYEVDADQEMLALGVGSFVGSCFGAYVCTGNLTRSAILAQLGVKTLLASLVGALMVMMSLLWFTVLFERIPNTILAAVVLVALRSLMSHTMEAKRLWRVGRRKDALIWWSTFVSVTVFSIEIGLGVGLAVVVLLKLYKNYGKFKKSVVLRIKQSVAWQRLMLMLGLQSPLFTTRGRGLYVGDDEDDY